ncbi:MAG: DUF1761 domain-containing protein [Bacteroidota bacterium]
MLYVELLIAAIAAFALGFLWYTALFGKVWQAETGITDEQAKTGIALTHGVAFLMMFVIAYFTNGKHMQDGTIGHGAYHAMENALYFAIPLLIINYMYQKKSFKLILIDAGYAFCFFCVIGGVMAALKLYDTTPDLETATKYMEYFQGRVDEYQGIIDGYNSGGN